MRSWMQKLMGKPEKPSPAMADIEGIGALLDSVLGNEGFVLHEIVSDEVHVDVMVYPPRADRQTFLLVTCGMSALPMSAPDDEARFAELCLELPPDWLITPAAFKNERNYWPVRLLKDLARLPHRHQTWFALGHTVANGDPDKPYADNTRLCAAMLVQPVFLPEEIRNLPLLNRSNETARLFQVVPIYRTEMEYKLEHGFAPFIERLTALFEKMGAGQEVVVDRPDCCYLDTSPPTVN